MFEKIIDVYVFLFGRVYFQKLNKALYRLSLGGLGVLNYRTSKSSGEKVFLENYLKNCSGVLVDVGANQGSYAIEALGICKAMKVYAFEPHPITYVSLAHNVLRYPNIAAINKGMSSEIGVLKIYDYPGKDGSSHASLFEDVITEIHGAGTAVAHEVELTTLDEFVQAENIIEINLLKVDTEGNELAVLKGAANSIADRKIKAIHFEFNEMNVSSRVFFKDFWRLLQDYRLYRLLPNGMIEIRNYSPLGCEIFAYQNIVAILKDQLP
ncbi:MAG: FkbM family methyltransferase [Azoarcus sp.]